MRKICSVLEKNDRKFEFENLCVIRLFTSQNDFCNVFQADQRNRQSGCAWKITAVAFRTGLGHLSFVQRMGCQAIKISRYHMQANINQLKSLHLKLLFVVVWKSHHSTRISKSSMCCVLSWNDR